MSAFKKAVKHESKLRLAISGPSGSGKTYSALAIGTGLGKVALVDTEHGSASKYADIFEFDVMELDAPYHPQRYVEAIHAAEAAGYDVVVIDSLTHAWAGQGGVLSLVDDAAARSRSGNSYTAWKEGTPVHNMLVEAIVTSKIHVIGTMRSKTEYTLVTDSRGKQAPQKMGMAPIQRDGFEYEFDIMFEMDIQNRAVVTKTRCPDLTNAVIERPNGNVAETLKIWLSGAPDTRSRYADGSLVSDKATPHYNEYLAMYKVPADSYESLLAWHKAGKPQPQPTETTDPTTGELIPTTAPTANAFSTQ
jgi:hypothetical protein